MFDYSQEGQLCCSYDYRCAGDLEDKRNPGVSAGESAAANLPSSPHIVEKIIDPSERALSTSWRRDYSHTPLKSVSRPNSGSIGVQRFSYNEDKSARSEDVGNSEFTTNPSGSFTSETSLLRNSRFSSEMDLVSASPSVPEGANEEKRRREKEKAAARRAGPGESSGQSRAVSRSSAGGTSGKRSTGSVASRATTPPPPTTTSSKKPAPISRAVPIAADQAAATSLRAFNIQTARYVTSRNPKERKPSFGPAERRRRTERGPPRLINGNPSGHDAT